jgi:hypothetical protein
VCVCADWISFLQSNPAYLSAQFGSLFEIKPAEFNKFWDDNGGVEVRLGGEP